ncbi:hypothetical protein [Cryobacterium serini]|uniref:Uncharacterized protein n=1 Tax=Cryobacterium serini TaxID=1259201 RepID=A0A4R9BTN1_9MICO|nr:hypothetical protein [Cryobacterium serini]TFD90447.1 hypothetical protein E3T51_02920 [Cryobacterium serini]
MWVFARTLPASNLVITPGTITAGTGSDAAPTVGAVTISNVAQSLVYTTTLGKGTFTLAPTFDLNVPADTYRSNYSAAIGSTAVNPYVSTITFTIASLPFSPGRRLNELGRISCALVRSGVDRSRPRNARCRTRRADRSLRGNLRRRLAGNVSAAERTTPNGGSRRSGAATRAP